MGEGRREQGERITTFVLKYQICNLNYEQLTAYLIPIIVLITAFLIKMKYHGIWHHLGTISYCSLFPVP
jgi:hypothetical protein